jgi:hypothetical protein
MLFQSAVRAYQTRWRVRVLVQRARIVRETEWARLSRLCFKIQRRWRCMRWVATHRLVCAYVPAGTFLRHAHAPHRFLRCFPSLLPPARVCHACFFCVNPHLSPRCSLLAVFHPHRLLAVRVYPLRRDARDGRRARLVMRRAASSIGALIRGCFVRDKLRKGAVDPLFRAVVPLFFYVGAHRVVVWVVWAGSSLASMLVGC